MEYSPPRILLAVEPGVLGGALAKLLSDAFDAEVVQTGRRRPELYTGTYDAAVVCNELPEDVRAHVVITLPDTWGSGGTGTVKSGQTVRRVAIPGAERVVELLEQYLRRRA